MSRLLLLRPTLLRRAVQSARPGRLSHSERPRRQDLSPMESAVGLIAFFTTLYTPAAYVLTNLKAFKRD